MQLGYPACQRRSWISLFSPVDQLLKWELYRNNSDLPHVYRTLKWLPKYMPMLAKWSFLPHCLHRLCSGEKPSTHVVPGYPGLHGCCHGNLQPISIDLYMESLRRAGRDPKGLEFPKAGPPADRLHGILEDTGQCPGKQVLIQWPGVDYCYLFFLE